MINALAHRFFRGRWLPLLGWVGLWPAGVGAIPPPVPEPTPLTEAQLVALALSRSHTVAVESLRPEIAAARLRQAQGQFDPALTARASASETELAAGGETTTTTVAVGVEGELPTGATYVAELSGAQTGASGRDTQWRVAVIQPLLGGFGPGAALSAIRVARRDRELSDWGFRSVLIDEVTETLLATYDLYYAREALRISTVSRDLAAQLARDNRERVAAGAMARVDALVAESEVALRTERLLNLQVLVRARENGLKLRLTQEPEELWGLSLVIAPPQAGEEIKGEAALDFAGALSRRPDYQQAMLRDEIAGLRARDAANRALPTLDLTGEYVGGVDAAANPLGFGDEASLSLRVRAPIPNRAGWGNAQALRLSRNLATRDLQRLRQQIAADLDTAAAELSSTWARIEAAKRARALAAESLAGEEEKLRAGTSTTFVVLRLQQDLVEAELRELLALTDYRKAVAEYDRQAGRTLDTWRIVPAVLSP